MPTNEFEDLVFSPNPPIINMNGDLKKAVSKMRKSAERTIFVVDDRNTLKGVVTEGDLMRALEANQFLQADTTAFMNSAPIFSAVKLSNSELTQLFIETGLLLIPIVDEFGRLIGSQSVRAAVKVLMKSV